jgi:hypothetical protein
MARNAPPLSRAGASDSEDSGTKRNVPPRAITARTTLTAKEERQENHSRRTPQHSNPKIALPPATAAQTLTALVRSAGGNVPVIVDRVAGMTKAAPNPMSPRNTISSLAEDTAMATPDAPPKTSSPAMRALRRP